jgi:hypothetical protein
MLKLLNYFFEFVGWLLIVASPLLIASGIGLLIYLSHPSQTNFYIAAAIAFFGLVFGVVWATKIWKSKGTISFLSSGSAIPEIDDNEEKTDIKQ